jgi:hypothetical protein
LTRITLVLLIAVLLLLVAFQTSAYHFHAGAPRWSGATATFYVDIPGGNGIWNTAFETAMSQWNTRTSFHWTIVRGQYSDPCNTSGTNGVGFRDTLCDNRAWGSTTLAVAYSLWNSSSQYTHAGIAFNRTKSWSVYSGNLQSGLPDFRRTAVHEIGHTMGLDHEPTLPAISVMYPSILSNIEVPQADDIAAIAALYGSGGGGTTPPPPPTVNRPPNDAFSDATAITGYSGSVTGSNVSSTAETGEGAGVAAGTETPYTSVWWKWTAPDDGNVVISTNGSDLDTILGVYVGSTVGTAVPVVGDDDSGDASASLVSFSARINTTYRIQVRGYSRATGSIRLNWNLITAAPADALGPAISITSHSNGQTVSTSTIALAGTATDSARGNNGVSSVTVDGVRASGDTASGSGTASWSRTVSLVEGVNTITVVARDASSNSNASSQQISITRTSSVVRPSNDDFNNATTISGLTGSSTGTNVGSTAESGEPGGYSGDTEIPYTSTWWRWTAPSSGSVVITTASSDFDTILSVYSGSSLTALSLIAADDDSGSNHTSSVTFAAAASTTYRIQVRGYARATGSIRVNWTETAISTTRPLNDDFGNAITVTGSSGATSGTSVDATQESGEPSGASIGSGSIKSVWWVWTAPGSGTAVVDTVGSNFNTVLSVYTGPSVNFLSTIVADDNSGGGVTSRVEFAAVTGQAYRIQVAGYNGETGTAALNWNLVAVTQDLIAPSLNIISHSNGQTVATPSILLLGTASDVEKGNSGISAVTVNGLHASGDTASGSNSASWSSTVNLNLGQNTITIVARDNSPGLNATTATLVINRATSVTNDNFVDATTISGLSGTVTGTNAGSTGESGEPPGVSSGAQAPITSAWWRWTAPSSGSWIFDTLGSNFDTVLSVYTGNVVPTLTVVGANDNFDGLTSRMALTATAGTTYFIQVRGYASATGSIVLTWAPASATSNTVTFSISDRGGQVSRLFGGSTLTTGYGRVLPSSGNSTPTGVAVFGYRQSGILLTETAVPASATLQSGSLYVEQDGRIFTGLAMANPGATTVVVAYTFRDSSANVIKTGSVLIPAGTQLARFLNESPFDGPQLFLGTFTFTSSAPIAVVPLRGQINERGEFLLTTLPLIDLQQPASTATAYVPHFAEGAGWRTQLALVNPTSSTIRGTLQFTDPNGSPVALTLTSTACLPSCGIYSSFNYTLGPNNVLKIVTSGNLSTVRSGRIAIIPDSGNTTPVVTTVFSYKPSTVTVTESGLSASTGLQNMRLYTEFSQGAGAVQTGIAIAAGSSGAVVNLTLTNLAGVSTGLTGQLTLPAHGQVSRFLNQIPGMESISAPFQGVLRISSSSPITAIGLRGRTNERGDFLISTMPVTNEDAAATSLEMLFPHFAVGNGYTTDLIFFSGSSGQTSSGSTRFYDGNGVSVSPSVGGQ